MTVMERKEALFGRVVVAVDMTGPCDSLLEMAARMASLTRGELIGLFVEDIDLINLSALPFAKEISRRSVQSRDLQTSDVEQEMKRTAALVRAQVARAAERAQIPWRFDVVRGSLRQSIEAASRSCDLLVLSEDPDVLGARYADLGLGIVAQEGPCNASLLVSRGMKLRSGPVVALVDAGADIDGLYDKASQVAEAQNQPLIVVTVTESAGELEQAAKRANEGFVSGRPVKVIAADGADLRGAAQVVLGLKPGVVVVAPPAPSAQVENHVRRLANLVQVPVLILQGYRAAA